VVDDPGAALRVHEEWARQDPSPPPIVVVPGDSAFDIRATVKNLPKRDWVVVIPKILTARTAKLFSLARRLGARVRLVPADSGDVNWSTFGVASQIIDRSDSWEKRLDGLIEGFPTGFPMSAFLGEFGMTPETITRAKRFWSMSVCSKIHNSLGATKRSRSFLLSPRITILETDDGWLWSEKDLLVAGAVPVDVTAYRGESGEVRHRGWIRHGNELYPFDSATFRDNTAGVIEEVLLRAGVRNLPIQHPILEGRIAMIAMYWSQ
jgi:hypothetical protein